ncbi:FecR family protein [Larkinella soli]|uniref:FecR family protein n=1 Tax=Larkinella soli TaxID=1770527 RepID=UPI000FFC774A|nr:FecR family protein [Larkinella soli]
MKDYTRFLPEDFAQDPYFRRWVLGELPPTDTFWITWQVRHPEQDEIIEQARILVWALQVEDPAADSEEVRQGIDQILDDTQSRSVLPFYRRPAGFQKAFRGPAIRWAASVLMVLGLGYGAYTTLERTTAPTRPAEARTTPMTDPATGANGLTERVRLSDGSKVTLTPGSRLRVSPDFGKTERTVYLTGEAFFEVTRNPAKPFLVYTGNVVTKVLGTSFRVRAYEGDSHVSVAVRTGRVMVAKAKPGRPASSDAMVLLPNQQALYSKADEHLIKTLVENPVMLITTTETNPFEFREAPLPQVLSTLEQIYGVKMIYDAKVVAECNLTAQMGNEPLFEKLNLICEMIQARYEVVDGQVVLYSNGCK